MSKTANKNPSTTHTLGRIVLAGNPNCGKTALFNALTGSTQRVGNWPGVTVEQRSGHYREGKDSIEVVDLPGTYSLSVYSDEGSIDQRIACSYLLSGQADLIVNVIDGSSLERHLYLSLQLRELSLPMVLAVNMMDIVEKRGIELDLKKLSSLLGCPVIPMAVNSGRGVKALQQEIKKQLQETTLEVFELKTLPPMLEKSKQNLAAQLTGDVQKKEWLALRLLEGDVFAKEQVTPEAQIIADQHIQEITQKMGEEPDILIADARYRLIDAWNQQVSHLKATTKSTVTEKIDRVVLNRFLGIPIFFGVMYLMFVFAINFGGVFQDFFDQTSTALFVDGFAHLLTLMHSPSWLTAILAHGVGKGLNTVVTFIPILGAMFLFLAFLEDCGYMARAAFVMDRFMQTLGLPGKSFVPMIVGFGCNVPAVMGARSLEGNRDRILTVLMMPFMSCGARLAIFAVFASAFFPVGGQDIIFLLYVTGIAAAIATGLILRKTLLPGKPAPLVMELPTYHLPRPVPLVRHSWNRLRQFIRRAGRVIVPVCVVIGGLNAVTVYGHLVKNESGDTQSVLSQLGRTVTPILSPMGVQENNWPATVGLVTGVLAKEVVVGTLNTLYSQSSEMQLPVMTSAHFWGQLKEAVLTIPENFSNLGSAFKNPLLASEPPQEMNQSVYGVMYERFGSKSAAFSYLLFVLLYFPCISTLAAMRKELNNAWAMFSLGWSTGLAYAVATVSYQSLTLLSHPLQSTLWIVGVLGCFSILIRKLRRIASPLKLKVNDQTV